MVDDVQGLVDRQKVRDDLEGVLSGIGPLLAGLARSSSTGAASAAPARETWGLGPEAEAGMAGMMRLAGGG